MEEIHHINKGGPMLPQRKKQRTLFDVVDLDSNRPKDQALMNAFISSFEPLRFQHLLIRWVACDNIPFHKLESPYFRDLMAYANSAIADSGSIPTHSTIRDWIVRSFNCHKGVVTELLRRSLSRINVSFDAWSSRKFTSLLGLTVHFIDDEGKFRTFLLGLPRIEGRHCGENLADRVSEIIHEYGFEDRVGYFVTDNAESNDTCLEDLGAELGFNKQHRRLRCCGHIINLVARSILFGTDADAFEEDCQANQEIQDERIERLHMLQSIENTALGLEDKTTYDVVMDNATRWNSSEAMMERGYMLRNALDSLVKRKVFGDPETIEDRDKAPRGPATTRQIRRDLGSFAHNGWLLKHLEEAKLQHERDEEPYLRIGCNLGWMKLDQYYALTEDSPAYLASLVLHPAFRWSTVESQWSDHPDWLARGRAAVQELWEEYRTLAVEQDTIPEEPTAARKTTDLDDFMTSIRKLGAQPAPSPSSTRDEYAEWVASTDPGDCLVDNPIQYWLLRRRQYPRLSRMAIDLFSIPAMSSEPERIFSLAGQMVTAQRGPQSGPYRAAQYLYDFDPKKLTFRQAMEGSEKDQWVGAIDEEVQNLIRRQTFSEEINEVDVHGEEVVDAKLVFDRKKDKEGKILRYKARLVARGFTQKHGINYEETFAPTIRLDAMRIILALAAKKGWKVYQMDAVAAFLAADLKERIFMKVPTELQQYFGKYAQILKSLSTTESSPCTSACGEPFREEQFVTLLPILRDFGILRRLGSIVGDNSSTNDTLCRAVSTYLKEEGVKWDPEVHRLRCLGHVINLAVQAFLFQNSIDLKEGEICEDADDLAKVQGSAPNFAALDHLQETASALDTYTKNHFEDLSADFLLPEDWARLRIIEKILQPFARATLATQGSCDPGQSALHDGRLDPML
ncbi:reverse transcriptase (RNA-dependent DNA polymerase) [Hirsutella rhossiliensis]